MNCACGAYACCCSFFWLHLMINYHNSLKTVIHNGWFWIGVYISLIFFLKCIWFWKQSTMIHVLTFCTVDTKWVEYAFRMPHQKQNSLENKANDEMKKRKKKLDKGLSILHLIEFRSCVTDSLEDAILLRIR